MIAHSVTNVDDVAVDLFGCVYSPAKRRGPVPGRAMLSVGSCRPEDMMYSSSIGASCSTRADVEDRVCSLDDSNVSRSVSNTSAEERLPVNKKRRGSGKSIDGSMSLADTIASDGMDIYQSFAETAFSRESSKTSFNGGGGSNHIPQIMLSSLDPCVEAVQQRVLSHGRYVGMNMYPSMTSSSLTDINGMLAYDCTPSGVRAAGYGGRQQLQDVMTTAQNSAQQQLAYVQQLQARLRLQAQKKRHVSNIPLPTPGSGNNHPDIQKYLPLLHPANQPGMHLRACYTLAFGGLLGLPPIPTDEEYCRRFGPSLDPIQLPQFDVAALRAARFAELAMGALTKIKHGELTLLVALTNASVLCLQNCANEKVHPSLILDLARAYFFHAIIRSYLDDMKRYFEYRKICLRQLTQLDVSLISAVSFFVCNTIVRLIKHITLMKGF